MAIVQLDKQEGALLSRKLYPSKLAVGVLPYFEKQIQLIRRVKPPFPGRYSIITGQSHPHIPRKLKILEELYEELFSTYPSQSDNPHLAVELLELHDPIEVLEIGDTTTGYHISVYTCQLHSKDFIPYAREVDDVKSHLELEANEMNPLTQFILWQRGLLEKPHDDIRYANPRILRNSYVIDYDHPNVASTSS